MTPTEALAHRCEFCGARCECPFPHFHEHPPIEQAAEAADREAADGYRERSPDSSAAADPLDVKRLEEAMYEVAVNQMNLFDWPSAKDVAAAYAEAVRQK